MTGSSTSSMDLLDRAVSFCCHRLDFVDEFPSVVDCVCLMIIFVFVVFPALNF